MIQVSNETSKRNQQINFNNTATHETHVLSSFMSGIHIRVSVVPASILRRSIPAYFSGSHIRKSSCHFYTHQIASSKMSKIAILSPSDDCVLSISKCTKARFPPQTPHGELTTLPSDSLVGWGGDTPPYTLLQSYHNKAGLNIA